MFRYLKIDPMFMETIVKIYKITSRDEKDSGLAGYRIMDIV